MLLSIVIGTTDNNNVVIQLNSSQFQLQREINNDDFRRKWGGSRDDLQSRLNELATKATNTAWEKVWYTVTRQEHGYDEYNEHTVIAANEYHARLIVFFEAPNGDESMLDWFDADCEIWQLPVDFGIVLSDFNPG